MTKRTAQSDPVALWDTKTFGSVVAIEEIPVFPLLAHILFFKKQMPTLQTPRAPDALPLAEPDRFIKRFTKPLHHASLAAGRGGRNAIGDAQ